MPRKPKLEIYRPVRNDLPAIVEIYNQAIRSGVATGHTREFTVRQRWKWYRDFSWKDYPIYVMAYDKKIIGYGTLSPYRKGRQGMRSIAEVSFFLDESHQGKGYGSILLQRMLDSCPRLGIKTLLAVLLGINKKSIRMLKKFGFKKWGHFPDVIELEDRVCGQLIYGLKIEDSEKKGKAEDRGSSIKQ